MAREPVTLRITQGTDEANDGTQRFRVDPDGMLTVPADVADRLLQGGGFIEVVGDAPAAPQGMVRVRNPSSSGCSWGGFSYEADEDGVVTVPVVAEPDLAAHGFARVAEVEGSHGTADLGGDHEELPPGSADEKTAGDEGGDEHAADDQKAAAAKVETPAPRPPRQRGPKRTAAKRPAKAKAAKDAKKTETPAKEPEPPAGD